MDEDTILRLARAIIDGWDEADCDGEQAAEAAQDDDAWDDVMAEWLTELIEQYSES